VKAYALGLDSTKWNLLMGKLTGTRSTITMPKFKFSYGIDLKDILESLGMSIAFSDHADFSRISSTGLTITEVKHKAYIDVNEDGTEAAAATSVGMGLTAAPTKNIILDKPFIFAIREMKTGLILFAGVMSDPTKSE
jgi:serpin B